MNLSSILLELKKYKDIKYSIPDLIKLIQHDSINPESYSDSFYTRRKLYNTMTIIDTEKEILKLYNIPTEITLSPICIDILHFIDLLLRYLEFKESFVDNIPKHIKEYWDTSENFYEKTFIRLKLLDHSWFPISIETFIYKHYNTLQAIGTNGPSEESVRSPDADCKQHDNLIFDPKIKNIILFYYQAIISVLKIKTNQSREGRPTLPIEVKNLRKKQRNNLSKEINTKKYSLYKYLKLNSSQSILSNIINIINDSNTEEISKKQYINFINSLQIHVASVPTKK